MKKGIHPADYKFVVFEDLNNGNRFLTRATTTTKETTKWEDGNEYPLIKVHISSSSHPFFTGEERIVDVEGRVDKFKARQAAADAKKKEALERAKSDKKDKKTKKPVAKKLGR